MSKCTKHVLDVKGIEKLKIEDETKIKGSTKKGERLRKDKGKVFESDSKNQNVNPSHEGARDSFVSLMGLKVHDT